MYTVQIYRICSNKRTSPMNSPPPQALWGQKKWKMGVNSILINNFLKKVNRKINALVRLLEQIR
jgi:hypothetical protein